LGPHGFTDRFVIFDFFHGGHLTFDMLDEKGKVYSCHVVFQEIVPNEKISWIRLS
jgi:uncharacterized protein YndB with AHSA1/START domain